MTFEDIILQFVVKTLPGYTLNYQEGCDLTDLKNKGNFKSNKTAYINLSGFNKSSTYSEGGSLLSCSYELYIHTDQPTSEVLQRVSEMVTYYNKHPFTANLNSTDYRVQITDNGGSLINDAETWIRYDMELYV